jgi:hypothetical protein
MTSRTVEKVRKADRELTARVLTALMQHTEGRRWVWLMLELHRIFEFSENTDPGYMAFTNGRKFVGHMFLSDIQKFAPNDYMRMILENKADSALKPETEIKDDGRINYDDI